VTVVAGVDAYRGGWIAIVLKDGRLADALFASGFVRLLDGLARATAAGVDIPIGLPEEGPRAADLAARAFVAPRRGSVPACSVVTPTVRRVTEAAQLSPYSRRASCRAR
jgi:predicted RNase H-like nuclease